MLDQINQISMILACLRNNIISLTREREDFIKEHKRLIEEIESLKKELANVKCKKDTKESSQKSS